MNDTEKNIVIKPIKKFFSSNHNRIASSRRLKGLMSSFRYAN